MNYIEKRKMERFDLELPALISITDEDGSHKTFESVSSNICSGGAFFALDKPLSIGTDVNINMILPVSDIENSIVDKSLIDVSGSVIRTEPKGMAVCFYNKFKIMPYKNR